MSAALTVQLPYPPSANRLWRNVRGRVIRSPEYIAWMSAATWQVRVAVAKQHDKKGVVGPYGLTVRVCPPDKRQRDLDNVIKPLSDALAKGGAVENDRLCQEIDLRWCPNVTGIVATVMETQLRIPATKRRRKTV